jgi:nucleotide-binding universal stress UspA family protein
MSFRNILVHVESGKNAEGRARWAVGFAAAHGAHLTALAFAPNAIVPSYGEPGIVAPLPQSYFDELKQQAQAALTLIGEAAAHAGVAFAAHLVEGMAGDLPQRIGVEARVFDLTIVGQPSGDAVWSNRGEVISRLLMASGRPLLVVPRSVGEYQPIDKVVAGWDGGAEAARSINDALPLLVAAKQTLLLVGEPAKRPDLVGDVPGADLAQHLARHGVTVELRRAHSDELNVGEMILARAAQEGAGLIVMGGFHHSRLRELLLGGVTKTVLEHMTVPVLLSH